MLCVALVAGAVAALGIRWWQYENHVLPGVEVAKVDVGGLSAGRAEEVLAAQLGKRLDRPVDVQVRSRVVQVRPSASLRLDAAATTAAALDEGRGSFWQQARALVPGVAPARTVEPVVRIDAYGAVGAMRRLGASLPAPRAATVRMEGVEAVVVSSKRGVRVARPPLLRRLRASALGAGRPIVAPLQEYEPPVRTPAAKEAAAVARSMVAAPVRLTYRGNRIGALERRTLATLLRFRPRGPQLALGYDRASLARVVRPALEPYRERATNARFVVSGSAVAIAPSRTASTSTRGARPPP